VIIVELFFGAFILVLIGMIGKMVWSKISKARKAAFEKKLRGE